ncbi:MAG: GNAT family N-acetyltransferase [Chloroflexota bacterium]
MTLALQATPYERKYRDDILSLMFYSRHTHTHLDWYKAGTWLDTERKSVMLAFNRDELVGVMGVADPLHGASWIRLAIIARSYDPAMILSFLWQQTQSVLRQQGANQVAVLVINPWLAEFLPALGFSYQENVVTMHRQPQAIPPAPTTQVTLRNGYLEDLHQIVAVDHAAFPAPWQMSAMDLRVSQRQAASCTVAIDDGNIIGYEIATRHNTAGHLARLAVHPAYQGKRVGQHLLHHLLTRLSNRGVKSMTVNTQDSNIRSQRLYQRYGFLRNGFDLAVWMQSI